MSVFNFAKLRNFAKFAQNTRNFVQTFPFRVIFARIARFFLFSCNFHEKNLIFCKNRNFFQTASSVFCLAHTFANIFRKTNTFAKYLAEINMFAKIFTKWSLCFTCCWKVLPFRLQECQMRNIRKVSFIFYLLTNRTDISSSIFKLTLSVQLCFPSFVQ